MSTAPPTPPTEVRAAFAIAGPPEPLTDAADSTGRETSLRFGATVVKQVHDPALAEWSQGLLARAAAVPAAPPTSPPTASVTIPRPIRAIDGRWVVDGWTATTFVPGLAPGMGRWADVARAGRAFHATLRWVLTTDSAPADDEPAPIRARTDRWARADRIVWGDADPPEPRRPRSAAVGDVVDRLRGRLVDATVESQVVHADLTGNVGFTADGRAVVLDFSPVVRAPDYAVAIVAADAMLWHDAEPDVAAEVGLDLHDRRHQDVLARALGFRLWAEQLALDEGERPRHGGELDDHRRVLAQLGW